NQKHPRLRWRSTKVGPVNEQTISGHRLPTKAPVGHFRTAGRELLVNQISARTGHRRGRRLCRSRIRCQRDQKIQHRDCRRMPADFHRECRLSTETCLAVRSTVTTGSLRKSVPLRNKSCRKRCLEHGSLGSLERKGSPVTAFSAAGSVRCVSTRKLCAAAPSALCT